MTYLSIIFFTIQFITIVPKYCGHCCGHCTCEGIVSHKSSMQTLSKSEPFWPWSARLAHAVSRPHAALVQRESACWVCGWANCFHCFLQSQMGKSCVSLDCKDFISCARTCNQLCKRRKLSMVLIIHDSFEVIYKSPTFASSFCSVNFYCFINAVI